MTNSNNNISEAQDIVDSFSETPSNKTLISYLLGELAEGEEQVVELHLLLCPETNLKLNSVRSDIEKHSSLKIKDPRDRNHNGQEEGLDQVTINAPRKVAAMMPNAPTINAPREVAAMMTNAPTINAPWEETLAFTSGLGEITTMAAGSKSDSTTDEITVSDSATATGISSFKSTIELVDLKMPTEFNEFLLGNAGDLHNKGVVVTYKCHSKDELLGFTFSLIPKDDDTFYELGIEHHFYPDCECQLAIGELDPLSVSIKDDCGTISLSKSVFASIIKYLRKSSEVNIELKPLS